MLLCCSKWNTNKVRIIGLRGNFFFFFCTKNHSVKKQIKSVAIVCISGTNICLEGKLSSKGCCPVFLFGYVSKRLVIFKCKSGPPQMPHRRSNRIIRSISIVVTWKLSHFSVCIVPWCPALVVFWDMVSSFGGILGHGVHRWWDFSGIVSCFDGRWYPIAVVDMTRCTASVVFFWLSHFGGCRVTWRPTLY